MEKIQPGTDVRAVVENHRILAGKLSTGAVLTTEEVKYLIFHYHIKPIEGGDGSDRNRPVTSVCELDGEHYAIDWLTKYELGGVESVFPAQIARKVLRQEKQVTTTVVDYVEVAQ